MSDRKNSTNETLLSFVQRIEKLEVEKAEIAADVREVKSEAKFAGFDVKVINALLRERKMTEAERQEHLALLETYRAAVGMLDGTPLSEAARRRLMGEESKPEQPAAPRPDGDGENGSDRSDEVPTPTPAIDTAAIDAARDAGKQAARDGKRVVDNPYVAGDPRRAAWDEGWCAQTGSDGMEVPEAWRRRKKPKGE